MDDAGLYAIAMQMPNSCRLIPGQATLNHA